MFCASLLIGTLSLLAVSLHVAQNVDNLIIGAVMPLVPGVAITNSFRDILAGHLISGTARELKLFSQLPRSVLASPRSSPYLEGSHDDFYSPFL